MPPRTNYPLEQPTAYFRGVKDRNCQQQLASNPYNHNSLAQMNAWEEGWLDEDAAWVAAGHRTLTRPAQIAAGSAF